MLHFFKVLVPHERERQVAALQMLQAAGWFSLMTVLARQLAEQFDPVFLLWVRGLIGACALIPFLLLRGIPLLGEHRVMLTVRASVGTLGAALMFVTAKWIPAADALSLIMTSALFVPFVASWLLKEKLDSRVLYVVMVGFIGVLLVVQPGLIQFNRGVLYGLAAAFVNSLVFTTLRGLSSREHPLTVVLYFLGGSAVFGLPFATFPSELPNLPTAFQVAVLAISGFIAQIQMTRAFAHAPAAVVAPYLYSEIIFAVLLGWCLLGEVPNITALLGMVLICAAGIGIGRIRTPLQQVP